VHVLAPAAELAANPLAGGVAVMTLEEALAAGEGWADGGCMTEFTAAGAEDQMHNVSDCYFVVIFMHPACVEMKLMSWVIRCCVDVHVDIQKTTGPKLSHPVRPCPAF